MKVVDGKVVSYTKLQCKNDEHTWVRCGCAQPPQGHVYWTSEPLPPGDRHSVCLLCDDVKIEDE